MGGSASAGSGAGGRLSISGGRASVLIAALLAIPVTAAVADDPSRELTAVREAIDARRDHDERLAGRSQALERELAEISAMQVRLAEEVQDAETASTAVEEELAALQPRIDAARAGLSAADRDLPRILGALVLLGRDPPDALLAMPGTVEDAMRTAILLGRILPDLDSRADRLRAELAALSSMRAERAALRATLARTTEELAADRARLAALGEEKATLRRSLGEERRELATEIAALGAQAETLQALIDRLSDAEATRAAEAEAARAARRGIDTLGSIPEAGTVAVAVPPPPPPPIPLPDRQAAPRTAPAAAPVPEPPAPISAAQGRLRIPASGSVVERFRGDGGEGERRGLTMRTRADAQVVAPYHGRVAFAGPFRGYGQLLILEHGEGYHSLLAGFSRIDCVVGQLVQTGEPVGIMGERDEGEGRLYLELRRHGQPIDPLPWLESQNRKVNG